MGGRRTRRGFLASVGTTWLLAGCLRLEEDTPTASPGAGPVTDSPDPTSPSETPSESPTESPTGTDSPTPEPQVVDVGALLPVSGGLEMIGAGMREAIDLAVAHVNDGGGPLDRELRVHVADTQSTSEVAQERYQELTSQYPEMAAVIGPAGSGSVRGLASQSVDNRLFHITPSGTDPQIAEAGWDGSTKYLGRTAVNDVQGAISMARVLTSSSYANADTAAFCYANTVWGDSISRSASERFHGETLQRVPFDPGQTDFSGVLADVFAGDPDAVGYVGMPESASPLLQQWADGNYGGQWVLPNTLYNSTFLSNHADVLEGQYLVDGRPETTEGTRRFESSMENPRPFSQNAYDAAFLVALAIERGGAADGTTVSRNLLSVVEGGGTQVTVGEFDRAREALAAGEAVDYVGASSPLEMNQNLEPIHRYGIFEITGGEAQLAETIARSYFEDKY